MIARKVERAVPPIGTFVDIDGDRVHYVDRGTGPAIVMIHGLAGVLQNFTHSLVDLLTERYRVVALDRPGSGYSPRKRSAPAHLLDQASFVARFIQTLGLDRPLVVGHSLGGAIALGVAIVRPDLPRALALIAPLTTPERHAPKAFRGLTIPSPFVRALVAGTIAVPMMMATAKRSVELIFAPEGVPGDFATAGGGLLGLRPSQFYNASTDMMAGRDDMPALVERYRDVRVPVSVLFGADDRILNSYAHGEALRERIRQARVRIVAGGHMLPVTQAPLVAEWIRSVDVTP